MKYNFEWDPQKAKTNYKKHGVAFETAASVFKDQRAVSIYDEDHSDREDRWITIGIDEATRTLVVIHTYLIYENEYCAIRIISARKATQKEITIYKG
ncbi:MAG: BrnT family toxin [Sulfuricurvum sp.]|nr:BrnT family toxin [Sulfuricurvum sp.]